MATMEPAEAEQEIDEVGDDMMGPLPVSKMEVRKKRAHETSGTDACCRSLVYLRPTAKS